MEIFEEEEKDIPKFIYCSSQLEPVEITRQRIASSFVIPTEILGTTLGGEIHRAFYQQITGIRPTWYVVDEIERLEEE